MNGSKTVVSAVVAVAAMFVSQGVFAGDDSGTADRFAKAKGTIVLAQNSAASNGFVESKKEGAATAAAPSVVRKSEQTASTQQKTKASGKSGSTPLPEETGQYTGKDWWRATNKL